MKILVINGPNMNLLGMREPNIYGRDSYAELTDMIEFHAIELNIEVTCVQTNHEGTIIDWMQRAFFEGVDGIILNPAGYTHTSVAIGDAVRSITIPTVEVHITDINNREAFRRTNYIKDACAKSVVGKGFNGYIEAMDYLYSVCSKK